MTHTLSSVKSSRRRVTPKMVMGGPGKIGKTTFAASVPKVIGILTEDGAHAIDVDVFPLCKNYKQVISCLDSLIEEDHEYRAVFLDSLDWLEPLIIEHTCKRNDWKNIEQPGYGKGYLAASMYWREILHKLDIINKKGMMVILIIHDRIKAVKDPMADSYDAHQLKLHNIPAALIKEWADVLGYCGYKVLMRDDEGDASFGKADKKAYRQRRMLFVESHPAHFGGNRFGLKDGPLDWNAFADQLRKINGGRRKTGK